MIEQFPNIPEPAKIEASPSTLLKRVILGNEIRECINHETYIKSKGEIQKYFLDHNAVSPNHAPLIQDFIGALMQAELLVGNAEGSLDSAYAKSLHNGYTLADVQRAQDDLTRTIHAFKSVINDGTFTELLQTPEKITKLKELLSYDNN